MATATKAASHTSHTPGPWKTGEWEASDNGEVSVSVSTDYPEQLCNGNRSIACMTGGYYTRKGSDGREQAIETNRANARLIAAAPELLDLCVRSLQALHEDDFPALRDELRAAIAKAKGGAE